MKDSINSGGGTLDRQLFPSAKRPAFAQYQTTQNIGYVGRCLVQATLPHSRTAQTVFCRRNGQYRLSITANPLVGMPYGSLPRILLAWITTEVVRKKERTILLSDTLTAFLKELDLVPTGGRWGTIPRLRMQLHRLLSCTISYEYMSPNNVGLSGHNLLVADSYALWWMPLQPDRATLWPSHITLGTGFFEELSTNAVPIDMQTIRALRRSPMALDIYTWLTYRMSYLSKPTPIPWESVSAQFGAEYASLKHFKPEFRRALKNVLRQYSAARIEEGRAGLVLKPSTPHVFKSTTALWNT